MNYAWATIGLMACAEHGLTDDEFTELTERRDRIVAREAPLEASRRRVIVEAAPIGPRPDAGPCPVKLRDPEPLDIGSFTDIGQSFQFSTVPINVVKRNLLGNVEGPRYNRMTSALANDVNSLIDLKINAIRGQELTDAIIRTRRLDEPEWLAIDGTLVVDRYVGPTVQQGNFTTGVIEGRFYLYDYASQQIICAADIRAENSDQVGVHKHMHEDGVTVGAVSDLERDLYRNATIAAIRQLQIAGPRLVELSSP